MATTPNALTPGKVLFLVTVLTGSLLVRLAEQFPSADIADVQAGLFATPDEVPWILTVYTMASFAGIVTSVLFIRALSIGRYAVVSSIVFAITAAAAGTAPDLGVMIALRAIQGFAAGGFGPAAFVAAFMVASGPRLPFTVTLLAFVLLLPGTVGPVVSGFVEDSFGWQSLFLIQAGIGAMLALAARAWAPRQAPDWSALKTDWTAVTLLSLALATLTLVLGQGTRRFWFRTDDPARPSAHGARRSREGDGHHGRAQDCERGTDLGSQLCDPGAGPDDGRAVRSRGLWRRIHLREPGSECGSVRRSRSAVLRGGRVPGDRRGPLVCEALS